MNPDRLVARLVADEKDLERLLHHRGTWSGRRDRAFISIFDLPVDILEDEERSQSPSVVLHEELPDSSSHPPLNRGLTCLLCELQFSTISGQQSHFKSEAHISKLRLSLYQSQGRRVRDDSDDSENSASSGDDKSSSEFEEEQESEDDEMDDNKQRGGVNVLYSSESAKLSKHFEQKSGPLLKLERSRFPNWSISLSTALCRTDLRSVANPMHYLTSTLKAYQDNPQWFVMILRSGRFCGVIYSGESVLAHKTFRRYTIRAKSGGSQSAHDNQGRKAKSAGAMLRRYGEQSLKEDVRATLNEWSSQLNECSLLLISVPKTMRALVFEDTPLHRDDPRLAYVPFMVNKPTLDESSRIRRLCSSVIFTRITKNSDSDPALHSDSEAAFLRGESQSCFEQSSDKATSVVPEPQPLPYIDETAEVIRVICESAKAGDLARLRAIVQNLDDEERSFVLNAVDGLEEMRTPLHIASAAGHADTVAQLLLWGANPCRADVRSRLPYFLCKSKAVREAYRKARATPEIAQLWDWDSAGVPPAISEDVEKQRKEKEKEKKKRAKQRKKEAKEREAVKDESAKDEDSRETQKSKEEPSQKAGTCAFCDKSLFGIKVLDVFDRRCCSTNCVILLRRRLAGEAALKRLAAI